MHNIGHHNYRRFKEGALVIESDNEMSDNKKNICNIVDLVLLFSPLNSIIYTCDETKNEFTPKNSVRTNNFYVFVLILFII